MKGIAILLQSMGLDPNQIQTAFSQLQTALPAVVTALKEMDERTKRIEAHQSSFDLGLNELISRQARIEAKLDSLHG